MTVMAQKDKSRIRKKIKHMPLPIVMKVSGRSSNIRSSTKENRQREKSNYPYLLILSLAKCIT